VVIVEDAEDVNYSYLVLFRPPARDMCLDALEDLWRNYDGAKAATGKLLARWRPHVLQETQHYVKRENGIDVPVSEANRIKGESNAGIPVKMES
jgi:hypothetical protein